jgi:hypothetical protein
MRDFVRMRKSRNRNVLTGNRRHHSHPSAPQAEHHPPHGAIQPDAALTGNASFIETLAPPSEDETATARNPACSE